jgi:hypothetical protein
VALLSGRERKTDAVSPVRRSPVVFDGAPQVGSLSGGELPPRWKGLAVDCEDAKCRFNRLVVVPERDGGRSTAPRGAPVGNALPLTSSCSSHPVTLQARQRLRRVFA